MAVSSVNPAFPIPDLGGSAKDSQPRTEQRPWIRVDSTCPPAAASSAGIGISQEALTRARLELLWQDLFSDPRQWWDNRQDKRSFRDPDFRHKRSKEGLFLDNRCKPAWVESQLSVWDAQLGSISGNDGNAQAGCWSKVWEQGQLSDTVHSLDLLVQGGCHVDTSCVYRVLKRCVAEKDLALGRRVHDIIRKCGYESDTFLANHVIRMYASHKRLQEARQVFENVPTPDAFMWCAIIKAHAENALPTQAMEFYRQMRRSTVKPDGYIVPAVLTACASARDLAFGREVHADVVGTAVEQNVVVGNCLVDMYAKCGSLADARKVFDRLRARDVVTWTVMIRGYAQHGRGVEAIALYRSMEQEGIAVADHVTFVCLLKACTDIGDLHEGEKLHSEIRERGLEADLVLGNCLVDMYAKCGSLGDARKVFDRLPKRDVVSWTAMIAGYAQHGLGQEALTLYASMQREGLTAANHVTFVCLLKACMSIGGIEEGKEIHLQIQRRGLEADVVIGSCLVDMYAKCGSLEEARRVFDRLPTKNVVTWNAMLTGYVEHGLGQEALSLYSSMQQDALTANYVTFVSLLQACASIGALDQGKQVHSEIRDLGLQDDLVVGNCLVAMYSDCGSLEDARGVFDTLATKDVVTWTSMITGYAKSGDLVEARRMFDSLETKNVVTWNALISGYVQHDLALDALALFASMQQEGITPASHVTFVCLLQACASVGALHQGKQLHTQIRERGLEADLVVGNCLVDMYSKCASIDDARSVFDTLPTRDVVTWTAMLNGYARHGDGRMAIKCFKEMQQEGVEPDGDTFSCLLVACCHNGLVNEGQQYFKIMVDDHGITPSDYHYTSMVDLLGRSGRLDEAEDILLKKPFKNDAVAWTSLLSACKSHGDVERGQRCFDRLSTMDPHNASAYVLMGNIFANAGRWGNVDEIERLRLSAGAWKKPAKACIEVKNQVREFIVGESEDDLSSKSRNLSSKMKNEGGHIPHTELVHREMSQDEKEDALCGHAEKLALAYGLLNTTEGTTLFVTKNMRMCDDCHSSTKILSRLEEREIIVRDAHRVHRFQNGLCSCGDRH